MLNPLSPDDARDRPRNVALLPLSPAPTHQGLEDMDPWANTGPQVAPVAREFEYVAPPRRRSWVPYQWLAEALEVVALALFMFMAVRGVAQNFIVDGGSMEPNFHNGELVIVNKLAFREIDLSALPLIGGHWQPFRDPLPGDVVVFEFPQDPTRDFIKRVIAVPGQTVEVREGRVYVDGTVVDEPYLSEPPHYAYGPTSVPPGQLFVLGDNRNNSYDSHSWGMLPDEHLIGRAEFRYWPLSAAGRIESHPILEASASGEQPGKTGGSASR